MRGILQWQCIFFFYFGLNSSVTKIFSLAKGNLSHEVCYVTEETVLF